MVDGSMHACTTHYHDSVPPISRGRVKSICKGMELTIPTPVTDARLEFSSLVFASNLSPTPPAAVTVSTQQVQDQYWIVPVQETNYNVLSQLCC